jgi:hypothetical protein
MPNQRKPGKAAHTVWVADPLWQAAKNRAADKGETVSDVLVRALTRYTKGEQK